VAAATAAVSGANGLANGANLVSGAVGTNAVNGANSDAPGAEDGADAHPPTTVEVSTPVPV
jgi:hypothetical protein